MSTDVDSGPPDFDEVTAFFARNWLLIGVTALCGALIGLGSSFLLPRVYRAEVVAAPVSTDGDLTLSSLIRQYRPLAGMVGLDVGGQGSSTKAAIAMLKSRSFVQQFIADNNLLPKLFPRHWDELRSRWLFEDGRPPPTLQDGYEMFVQSILGVVEDAEHGLVTVRVEWRDAEEAATWANQLVERLNETLRSRAISDSERSIEYLRTELENTQTVAIQQSIYSLLQSQLNRRMLAKTRPDFAFSVIDPAQPPDPNKYVAPVPPLLLMLGFFSGAFLGMIAALARSHVYRWRLGDRAR